MRSNIDLTLNQMFSSDSRMPERLAVVRSIVRPTFGWRSVSTLNRSGEVLDDESGIYEVIRTGNREQREEKQTLREINSGDACDCCGISLTRKPWSRHYGLCFSCAKRLDEHLPVGNKSKMPRHLNGKDLVMRADRRKNPFRKT